MTELNELEWVLENIVPGMGTVLERGEFVLKAAPLEARYGDALYQGLHEIFAPIAVEHNLRIVVIEERDHDVIEYMDLRHMRIPQRPLVDRYHFYWMPWGKELDNG